MDKLSKNCFFKACGGLKPIRLLLENRESQVPAILTFEQPSILIGQHPLADIRLQHPDIGQRHLYLQLLGGKLFAVAFPGTNPIRWGERIQTCGWFTERDVLDCGPFTLRIIDGASPPSDQATLASDPMRSSPNGVPPICLEQRNSDPKRSFRGMVNRSLSLLGNAELCKFRMHSARVSSVHCSLVRADNGFWVVDFSGGETLVNGDPIAVASLEEGDRLQLGGISFDIRYESSLPVALSTNSSATLPADQQLALTTLANQVSPPKGLAHSEHTDFERLIGPVLDRFTSFQNQTFQQFQDLLGNVMQMFGGMFQQQQEFVQKEMQRYANLTDELGRLRQRLDALPAAPSPTPAPPALPAPSPAAPPPRAPAPVVPQPVPNAAEMDPSMHLWLHSRINELDEQRNNLWSRLVGLFRGKSNPAFGEEDKNIDNRPQHRS